MPVESILQMLCTVNYVLNDEKLKLRDISIHEQEQAELVLRQEQKRAREKLSAVSQSLQPPPEHNTYDIERLLLRMVRKGDTAALRRCGSGSRRLRQSVVESLPGNRCAKGRISLLSP